ncbi:neuronal acetylcholine receptor subunit alpha-10-like [Mytilus galloprovincialis]|uniref:Nicotinic acetylcholine receptor, invertebrate n=1 Tax=Mytilus galloprovincialis TaxID=29158 RepID=A0A8B6DAX7_MYTGA|nr:nicotinic acetylcholine receptor, invertebrate [Mytilus galloprovincialis]
MTVALKFDVMRLMFVAFLGYVLTDENEYRLVRDLMTSYDKRIRPSENHSWPLNVTFDVALAQIIDVDEKNQIITTNCWLNQGWKDYMLRWDPRKYGNTSVIRLPYTEVWRPDILLYNNADVTSSVSTVSTNVIVTFDGNITWLSMWIFKSSCSIDVKYFPFDVQNCSMDFASWAFDAFQINIQNDAEKGDLTNYVSSSEWELIVFDFQRQVITFSCCPEPYVFINYFFVIKRRPLFYMFNLVMPCILITLVALLGFYMPSESGEKVSMGITTLLSMTVFLMIVADSLPPSSSDVPLIGLYYGINIAIVSFATAMTVFTLNIHHKGARGYEVPNIFRKIFFGVVAKLLCIKLDLPPEPGMVPVPQSDYYKYDDQSSENGGISTRYTGKLSTGGNGESCDNQFLKVLHKVNQTIERNEVRLAEQDRRDYIRQEWQQLALVIDRMLMFIFILGLFLYTIALFSPGNRDISNLPPGL